MGVVPSSSDGTSRGSSGSLAAAGIVIGRDAELARLEAGLRLVPCAVILGLAGVGKSALARQLASVWTGPVRVQHASDGGSLAGLIDDLRRELGVAASDPLAPEHDRFADLADQLDRGGELWLLEDADRIDGADRLLAALSSRLGRARVIATARGRIFTGDRDPDRVELVLDGLAEPAARQLWHHLDALYGAAPGFDAAWRHSAGNPFLLRQAHAGISDRDDPAAAAIATLDRDPRQLALALALAAGPVHRSVLGELMPEPRAGDALRVLLRRLIVEPAGDGRFAVHDLLRGALIRGAAPDAIRATHAQLAAALEAAPLDAVVRIRERARHLLGAEQRTAARALILASAQSLIRAGAAAELVRCLDAVGAHDTEVQFARARTLVRMLDLHRAYDQMIALGADGRGATDEMRATLAHVAMLTGRLELAARVGHAALAARGLAPALRIRLSTVLVLTRTALGDGEDARATCSSDGLPELARAYLEFTRAFSLWLEERDADAEAVMRRAWALCKGVLSFRARVLAPLFFASALARTGQLDESAEVLAEVERDVADFEDPLVQVSQRMIRVTLLECHGAFDAALQQVVPVEAAYRQAGLVLGVLWSGVHRGRLMLLTGRVRAGRAFLDELARAASEIGARAIVRLARDQVRADPLQALGHAAGQGHGTTARPGQVRRNRAIAALQALIEGRHEIARGYAVALGADERIDPLTAALVDLVRAGLADPAERAALYEQALTRAAAAGADPELLPAIAARAGIGPDAATAPAGGPGSDGIAIVIDTVHHEVRCEDRVVALARRPSVRRLLYTLAGDLGRAHDKASLARGIWNASYRPARHDGALWVNVKRLRELLRGTGLRVDSGDDGYRLRVDHGHVLRTTGS